MGTDVTKTVDARGRLNLGPRFAGQLVIVRQLENGSVEVVPAKAVPANEAWLHENGEARGAVIRGLEQARAGDFVDPPDLDEDASMAEAEGQ